MMRNFRPYLLLLLALLSFSCGKEPGGWDGPYIEFTLLTGDSLTDTKAEDVYPEEGIDRFLHENLISTVDFFFYPDDNTSAQASYHVRKTSGKNKSDIMRLEFTSEEINTLIFPLAEDISRCTVFVLVNYPGEDVWTSTALSDLLNIEVTTNFVNPGGSGENSHYHSNFMMSGTTQISLRGRNQILSASGIVNLERYAAKMTVGVNVVPQVVVGAEVWEPMLESMELYLVDAVQNVTLEGRAPSPSYFSFQNNAMRFTNLDGDLLFEKDGNYYNTYPFYMYPQKWVYGSTKSPDVEPYLKLVLPWHRIVGGYTQKQFYYKILIPDDYREDFARQFVRNNWYHIKIDVSILGAETDEASVAVDGSVYVVYWQDKNVVIKDAEIGKARYLSVEKDRDTLYNGNSTSLAYVSSHPVLVTDVRATRAYYGTAAAGASVLGGVVCVAGADDDTYDEGRKYLLFDEEKRRALNGGNEWYTDSGSGIDFFHTLNNNYKDTEFDYSPYTFSYTLVHADRPSDTQFMKRQTLVQYPGIYIETTPNTDVMLSAHHPEHWGYVYINNEQYTRPQAEAQYTSQERNTQAWKDQNIWRIIYYESGGRDMVKINATVLPPDSEFILGDPRQSTVDNLHPNPAFNTGPAIEGGERTLTWYYPTEVADRTKNMIAPSYRISSKHSGTEFGGTGLEQARWRCASFQENGFPAGRWRLPTMSEIRFAAQLSANGIFEWQFNGNYWSANGAVNVTKDTGVVTESSVTTALIRCVYDSWYWGDDRVDLTTFTWGDKER